MREHAINILSHNRSSGIGFLSHARAYEVLPEETEGMVPVVAFKALRRGWDRTRESVAAKNAAGKKGRKWRVSEIVHHGHPAVRIDVPKDKINIIKQSLNSQGFTEGQTP